MLCVLDTHIRGRRDDKDSAEYEMHVERNELKATKSNEKQRKTLKRARTARVTCPKKDILFIWVN